jgi:hypothetical protein
MCGIAGFHRLGNEPLPKMGQLIDTLYWGILPRGTDATGLLAMLDSGKVQLERSTVSAAEFVRTRKLVSDQARSVLLHTRYATVGRADDPRNAHPVINGTCAAIHNGTIYNHADLFRAFDLKRHAQVDSEIIPALVSHAGWEQAEKALALLSGGAATAIVTNEHPRDLILARTQSYPLHWLKVKGVLVWASTEHAIRNAWQRTYGRDPYKMKGATHGHLGEWTMVRCTAGKIASGPIERPKPPARPPSRPQEPISGPASGRGKPGVGASKKQRKRAAKKAAARRTTTALGNQRPVAGTQLTFPSGDPVNPVEAYVPRKPWGPAHLDPEPWMEETVRDLMRTYDVDYESAYEAVYGVPPMSDDDWLHMFGV